MILHFSHMGLTEGRTFTISLGSLGLVPDDVALAAVPAAATTPRKLLDRIRSRGRVDALKEDVAHAKALDLVVDSAKAISAPES